MQFMTPNHIRTNEYWSNKVASLPQHFSYSFLIPVFHITFNKSTADIAKLFKPMVTILQNIGHQNSAVKPQHVDMRVRHAC